MLKHKVKCMQADDRYWILSFDEMTIAKKTDYDKNKCPFLGNITLGNDTSIIGDELLLVLIWGIRGP